MEKRYRVIMTNRMDITDSHYQVDGGLTAKEVMEKYKLSKEAFKEAVKTSYLGKDGVFEYEIVREK